MTIGIRLVAALALTVLVPLHAVAADAPTLTAVLGRAGSYVADFERQLSAIAGEEHYVQEVQRFAKRKACSSAVALNCGGQLVNPMKTELRSHLVLVRTRPAGYVQFRDVFEVDGRAVRDSEERLTALFANPSADSEARKQRILQENARYNIGDVIRTMNVPLLALDVLRLENQARFSFKRVKDDRPETFAGDAAPSAAFRARTEVWVIAFQERERGTIVRTTEGRDVPSRGRLWIEPDTGRVLMTELISEDRQVRGTVDVSFQSEPLLGLLVPIEMRERYDGRRNGALITCAATYSGFRKFR